MEQPKKIYFASDFHLGDNSNNSLEREKLIIEWMNMIKADAKVLYLVGDIFDFWYEWRKVIPRGYVRFLGKVAEFVDAGIEVHFFTGNHDIWMFGYLEEAVGVILHRDPITIDLNGQQFYIGHGDGLGPGDYGYKFIKLIFRNRLAQWLFSRLHPNFSIWLMQFFSNLSREDTSKYTFKGNDKEWLVQFCIQYLKEGHKIDNFIFGHRHIDIDMELVGTNARYINLGEWMHRKSYGVFDGKEMKLEYFND